MHINYAGPIDGRNLLIFVDAYSKFLDVTITPTISANRTVNLCCELISRYGPPEVLVMEVYLGTICYLLQGNADHPPPVCGEPSTIEWPSREDGGHCKKDPGNWKRQLLDFLYSYRYTPCSASPEGTSPAELFFGWRINSPFTKWFSKPDATKLASTDPTDGILRLAGEAVRETSRRPASKSSSGRSNNSPNKQVQKRTRHH